MARYAHAPDGTRLAFDLAGQGEPAIVFIHGWGGNRTHWAQQAAALARNHTVVSIDLAGHGGSDAKREDWSIESFGSDVATVVDRLGLKDVVLVGHSMGGRVAVEAAAQLRGKVRGVIGVEALWDVSKVMAPATIDAQMREWMGVFERKARDYMAGMFLPGSPLMEDIVKQVLKADRKATLGSMTAIYTNNLAMQGRLASLQAQGVPVHLVNTEYWQKTNMKTAAFYNIDVSCIDGAGHYVMLEKPQEVTTRLKQLIDAMALMRPDHDIGFMPLPGNSGAPQVR